MNVKKYLKKQAKEDLQALETDRDREFLKQLENSVDEKKAPPKKHSKQWLWAIPSGAAACAVAVVLIVELVPFSGNDLDDVKYDANPNGAESSVEELLGALNNFTIHFTENQTVDVQRMYDPVSGDDLYYSLAVNETSESVFYKLEARIVVNAKYEFDDFDFNESFVTETYSNYTVKYSQEVIFDSDAELNLVRCKAKIEGKYVIYVTKYEEYSFENGSFLTVINQLFEFHE